MSGGFVTIPNGFFGGNFLLGGHFAAKTKKNKKKKKKPDSWFETCNAVQLKELCKAAKLPVSGTKSVLVQRLMACKPTCELGWENLAGLKQQLKEKLLVQTGNKFDLVLRLVHAEYGTGQTKRAATATIVDDKTGQEMQVLKKRKIVPKPNTIYTRVSKRMQAGLTQKRFQSHYGAKDHAPEVYRLMRDLIVTHCIEENMIETNPRLAEEMARAVFRAFYDNWQVMGRTGYECQVFREAVDGYAQVLQAVRPTLSPQDVKDIVDLLESIDASVRFDCLANRLKEDACVFYSTGEGTIWGEAVKKEYSVPRYEKENVFEQAIKVVMPGYEKRKDKPRNTGKIVMYNEFRNSDTGIIERIPFHLDVEE